MTNESRERYSHGYGAPTVQRQETRTAERDAYFLLPHLRAGMSLLDCGCASGSITLGLATVVVPGQVVGVDIEKSVIEAANATASEQGVSNVRFQVANIYELPFPNESFDAIFAHTVLEHLKDPMSGLIEMKRVLKQGGVIGVRDMVVSGAIHAPDNDTVREISSLLERQMIHNGGDPQYGRLLGIALRGAGFTNIELSATYSKENPEMLAGIMESRVLNPPLADLAIEQGWADRAELERIAASYKAWSEHPDAFFALSRCDAVGWKE